MWRGGCPFAQMDLWGLSAFLNRDPVVPVPGFSITRCLLPRGEKFLFQAAEDSNSWLANMNQFVFVCLFFFFFPNLYFSGLCHSHIPKLKDRSPIVCIPAASPPLSILCLCSPGLWQSLAGWHVSPGSLPSQIWPQCWFNTRSQFKGDEVYFIEHVWYRLLTPEMLFPCGLPRKTTPAVFHKSCYRKGLRGVPARVDWPPT